MTKLYVQFCHTTCTWICSLSSVTSTANALSSTCTWICSLSSVTSPANALSSLFIYL